MDPALRSLVESLHQAPYQCVLALTGGGVEAVARLLTVPGGSRTILEVVVPYNKHALIDFLGRRPEHYCSAETGRELARRAYERAAWLAPREAVAGVGCTASLATDRPKRGAHRFHLTVMTSERQVGRSLVLSKGARDREGEETIVSLVLLNAVADCFGLAQRLAVPLLPGETVDEVTLPAADLVGRFLRGELPSLCSDLDGRLRDDALRPGLLLPGSFNPIHEGHWRLAAAASKMTGRPAAFELSVKNVDKPSLQRAEIEQRRRQFHWRAPLWLTQAPTFSAKAELFPGVQFVVGADTAIRIVDPKYYDDSEERMRMALERMRTLGCRFLVAGRVDAAGKFHGLDDLNMPLEFRDLFTDIPAREFRVDVSSTQLRGDGGHRS